jgi:glycosyltransferase involved in cell wall biosynthesis
MMSTLQRKNPQGTIDAFITAFGRRDDVQLYVKIWETPGACIDRANVADLHAQFPNIHFIFDHFTYPQVLALIRDCDAYVSMHRAEGLGMGMLEAMSFGLPVIATDYGGNRDFVNAFTALPVPYRLLPVESVQDCYSPESIGVQGYWADPDVAVAAQHMQRLVQDTDLYERLSAAGNACYEKRKNAFLSCDWLGTLDPRRREPSRLRSPQLVGV